MTRAEHLAWAKTRAFEYLDQNSPALASASITCDLVKHRETAGLARMGATTVMKLAVAGDVDGMRKWIQALE